MTRQPDENLKPYATPTQWRHYRAWCEYGSNSKAAKATGCSMYTVRDAVQAITRKAARAGYAPGYDLTHPAAPGFEVKGTSTLYDANGGIKEQWSKTRQEGRPPEQAVPPLPVVSKVSTNYDEQGAVRQQWIQTRPDAQAIQTAWQEAARALAADLPKFPPLAAPPESALAKDLVACYPVGDHHLGMLSWREETGADWDIRLGEAALRNATDYLMRATPASEKALIAFLGDFMHYDSFETVTPTSRNLLDADGRFPKMVRASIQAMRYTIDRAALRHGSVHVIIEIGNHDLSSSIFLMECLAHVYDNDPRVTIDTSPQHYHYFEFGKTLVGTHHGHGAKPDRLPSIMAADRPEAWGRTRHRYWWTGHIHHTTVKDYEACSVESFRILAPSDAWAHQKGFRATRDMKAIMLHREYGEVSRHTVTPSMFL